MGSQFTLGAAVAVALLSTQALAHMEMIYPLPFLSKFNPHTEWANIDYTMTAPLFPDGSNFPCKGYHSVLDTPQGTATAEWSAGGHYNYTLHSGVSHGGGSCQASLSYDNGKTWTVIQTRMGSCTADEGGSYPFNIPDDAPTGDAMFAWTWFNVLGNREMYMNCAHVVINGGSPSRRSAQDWASLKEHGKLWTPEDVLAKRASIPFTQRPHIFEANVGNDCTTVASRDVIIPNPGPDEDVIWGEGNFVAPEGAGCELPGAQKPVHPGPSSTVEHSTSVQPTSVAPESTSVESTTSALPTSVTSAQPETTSTPISEPTPNATAPTDLSTEIPESTSVVPETSLVAPESSTVVPESTSVTPLSTSIPSTTSESPSTSTPTSSQEASSTSPVPASTVQPTSSIQDPVIRPTVDANSTVLPESTVTPITSAAESMTSVTESTVTPITSATGSTATPITSASESTSTPITSATESPVTPTTSESASSVSPITPVTTLEPSSMTSITSAELTSTLLPTTSTNITSTIPIPSSGLSTVVPTTTDSGPAVTSCVRRAKRTDAEALSSAAVGKKLVRRRVFKPTSGHGVVRRKAGRV